ncbi:deoxyguanosinetriphosphate triphosphohydrolase-like protein 2 [Roseibacillus persicicus]|uniref:Deoxyguanosinetriphosphate triphosphohydrolase-like protein 2 n=1 Tax=Roseibacillus persicicus TaxID=454148 RepID=A0A918WH68_9BACT|nr:deoxyguanosinetriphosphate triphosphohydrolase-like protein 2 [Roseibacillus persicicus]
MRQFPTEYGVFRWALAGQVGGLKNQFYREFDRERLSGKSSGEDYRSTFQIDRDRVLHTPAFRSLQSKTQVFWSGEYDFYRTRLTHSLEVAQIGRGICDWLQKSSEALSDDFYIDADLVEAVCLSHDLGHPPFGHAGERSLNHFMRDYGGFEGNAQTLRLLTERIFSEKRMGMDPSRAFLDGVLKYKSLWSELSQGDERPEHHFVYDQQSHYLDFVMGGRDFPVELTVGKERNGFKSVECAIMDWADDTAYSLNDLADATRAGFLTVEKLEAWADKNSLETSDNTPLGDLKNAMRRGRVDSFAGARIGTYIKSASLIETTNFMSAESNRYRFGVATTEEVRAESALFKKLAFEVVFLSPELKQLEHKGSYVLRKLWELLETRYVRGESIDGQAFPILREADEAEIAAAPNEAARARLICDFLAGMTDGSTVRMYRRLFEPGFGSIGDLV